MSDFDNLINDYVHKVAERDFGRPFLHRAQFLPLNYHGNTAGRMNPNSRILHADPEERRKSDIVIELRARDFMDPKFVKTVRHELIHYFLYIDGEDFGHNRAFKQMSNQVDAGGTYHHRGLEYLYLRLACPHCKKVYRQNYQSENAGQTCPNCQSAKLEVEDLFGYNKAWMKQADHRRQEILEHPRYVVGLPDGSYIRGEASYLPLGPVKGGRQLVQPISIAQDKSTMSLRQAFWTRDLAEARREADQREGQVLDHYQAWDDFVESPYLYRCKDCKRYERRESPFCLDNIGCQRCDSQRFEFKGIR
ncbi:SprT-like domain-containing protein [Lactococcus termiticola]|uniref:SprT family metallopeptidase n=1 Tax=Lactococcus termiticola TaxID=2169526 RepID=A0A2R5HGA2_9LACT|nr:SprT-like domain-containing protein [Lactococcus termiticola]GBG97093.1 SprT family metallopeptidase [Lactococcus termiticola]